MPNQNSWLGTRVEWFQTSFDDGSYGRAALFTLRKQRLPWDPDLKLLLAAVRYEDRSLRLYRLDQVPTEPIKSGAALLSITTSSFCLTHLQEYFEWPHCEAVLSGYTLTDLAESLVPCSLADEITRRWRKSPIPGWWLVHRGHLGVVFLRDLVDLNGRTCCVELNHLSAALYRGPISENEALQDHRKIKQWGLHDLSVVRLRQVMDTAHLVQLRMLMRQLRYWIYDFALASELPF